MSSKPLPWRQLTIICICRFAEPICFTVIFPFIVQMVRDFHMTDEKNVGYYVGLITSCFALTQLMTGILWGMLSDRIGRRPVILIGLVGTISSILLFGLSQSFIWALLSRSLCGLLNGNVGVLKSMVAELTMDYSPHERARAFSLLPLMFGLGGIIGPILGGFLSHPVTNFPSVFGNLGSVTQFLTDFPYFLPCAISAFVCILGLIFGLFFLEESHACFRRNAKDDEEEPLLSDSTKYMTFESENQPNAKSQSPTPTLYDSPPTLKESITPAVLAICITFAVFSFQGVYMDELFPIFTASSIANGGLGFSANEIGTALAFSGAITLLSQLFVLPNLVKRFGQVKLFQHTLFVLIFLYLSHGAIRPLYSIPDIHGEIGTKFWVWVGVLIMVAIRTCGHTICYTSCTILVNNAAPRTDALGTINGFSQCCASAARALGPAICGMIWSSALSSTSLPYLLRINVSFFFLATIAFITYYLSRQLDPQDYEITKATIVEEEELFAETNESGEASNSSKL